MPAPWQVLKKLETNNLPQINADQRRFKRKALIGVHLRSSAAQFRFSAAC